ncbi:DoxX family membrane protein [Streptomyces sp. NPDC049954]|uniref:DoxX family protein n=1 Tax=Streptomyces sp. NPDC049954 TaxID=3155779 RepID=UPI003441738B
MAVLRRIARPLLASSFVTGGLRTLRDPHGAASAAAPVLVPLATRIGPLTEDPVRLARLGGAVQLGAGTLLALGRSPRVCALALAASLLPTTLSGHAWRTAEDPEERRRARARFTKDLSLFGGLLLAAADTHGKPSVAYRTRSAARLGKRETLATARQAAHSAQEAADSARHTLADVSQSARSAAGSATAAARERLPIG